MNDIVNVKYITKDGEQELENILRSEVTSISQNPVEQYGMLDTISTAVEGVVPEFKQRALHYILDKYPDQVAMRQHFLTEEGHEVNVQMIDNYSFSDDLTWLKINLAVKKLETQLKAKKKEQKGREDVLRTSGQAVYVDTTMRLQFYRR